MAANFFGARSGIDCRKRDALNAFAPLGEKCARRGIVVGFRQHAEQFDVVRIEHNGVVARSHLGAMRAARGHSEAETLPVRGGLVEIPDHDHSVIDADDILERHVYVSPVRMPS